MRAFVHMLTVAAVTATVLTLSVWVVEPTPAAEWPVAAEAGR